MDKTIDENPLTGREFYLSVIKHYGFIPQCIKLKEECTELIEVIDKIIEAGITPAQTDTHSSKLLDDFICENVDVAIVIGQFNALLGGDRWWDIKRFKLNRLKDYIKYETEGAEAHTARTDNPRG